MGDALMVKRYKHGATNHIMTPDPEGPYVRYCDAVAQHERIVAGLVARLSEARELLQWYVDNDDTNDGQPGNEVWLAGRDRAKAFLAQTAEGVT